MIYFQLFFTFFQIGAFTFGGGYAMLPLIEAQVAAHGWLSETELVNFVAVSESTPGPFAVNVSTYVGMETAGLAGAACATLGVVLPSFLIILLVARCFAAFSHSRIVKGAMKGLKPAVVGLIGTAVVSTGKAVFSPAGLPAAALSIAPIPVSLGIFTAMLVLSAKKVHPMLILLLSAGCGIAAGYLPLLAHAAP